MLTCQEKAWLRMESEEMAQVKENDAVAADTDNKEPLPVENEEPAEEERDNMPHGTRLKVIVNPASGKKASIITTNSAGVADVKAVLDANGIEAEIVETEYPAHTTELARQAAKDGYDIVIACGGDGTVGEAAKG